MRPGSGHGRLSCEYSCTVVSIQIFLSDYTKDFKDMNEAYIEAFKGYGPLPVRTCVGIAVLPGGHDIEMTVVSTAFQGGTFWVGLMMGKRAQLTHRSLPSAMSPSCK